MSKKPALLAVPGLLGGAEDFNPFILEWSKNFHVIQYDPNQARRLSKLDESTMREISYAASSDELVKLLKAEGYNQAFLVGISIGGKIVIDFATRYPEMFLGGLITDVGPGPFEQSQLYQFVYNLVTKTDMNLPWPQMKEHLVKSIPDRSLRSLIQTQIAYPNKNPPAIWKTGMKNFGNMLERQEIGNQFAALEKVDERLALERRFIRILHAPELSGIPDADVVKIKTFKSIQLIPALGTHFLHINQKQKILEESAKFISYVGVH